MATIQPTPIKQEQLGARQTGAYAGTVFHYWMRRDSQRSKLYAAEGQMMSTLVDLKPLGSMAQVSSTCGAIEAALPAAIRDNSNYFAPDVQILQEGENTAGSYSPDAGIALSPRHCSAYTLVHEYCHHITATALGSAHAPHGAEFAGLLLALTQVIVGKDAAQWLKGAYQDHGVKATPVQDILRSL